MRGFVRIVSLLAAAAVVTAQSPPPQGDATKVLAAAREALGGEKRLSAVKTFVATGRTRQVRGDNLVPIEFEIACELPDKYVRKDEIPAQESGPTSIGFNGDALIQMPEPPAPPTTARAGGPPAPTPAQLDAARKGRVATVKQDFVRLALGMFAASFPSYPLTFTYVGQAEAPQGKADVLDAKGPGNFALRFFVNSQTHLPIMVSWQQPAPRAPGAPPGAVPPGAAAPPRAGAPTTSGPPPSPSPAPGAPSPSGPPTAAAGRGAAGPPGTGRGPAPTVEARLYYADYRDVDGLQLPFRLRRAVAGETIEETTLDRFRINAKIDTKKFEVAK